MRSRLSFGIFPIVVLLLTACEDSTGALALPILLEDTVEVAAPLPQNAALPTALDVTSAFGIRGGRFPERERDALEWDFAVRIQDGQMVLIPSLGMGISSQSPPGITTPLESETFEGLREAPGQRAFVRDSAIVMQVGNLHAARSREFLSLDVVFGGLFPCSQYAKLEPVEVDVANGILRLHILTNENCGDPRLVPVER